MIRSLDRSSTKIFLFSGINNDRSISVEEKKTESWYAVIFYFVISLTTDILIAFLFRLFQYTCTYFSANEINYCLNRRSFTKKRINENENADANSLGNISIILLNSHDCINIFNYIFFDEYKERITTVWKLRIIRIMKIYL